MFKSIFIPLVFCLFVNSTYSSELFHSPDQFSELNAPMRLELDETSPSGSRVFTTENNAGKVRFDFSIALPTDLYVNLLVHARNSSSNAIDIAVTQNGQSVLSRRNWSFDSSEYTGYGWFQLPLELNVQAGSVSVELYGVDAYTRIAGVYLKSKEGFTNSSINQFYSSISNVPGQSSQTSTYISPIDGAANLTNTVDLDITDGDLASALELALSQASPATKIVIPNGVYSDQTIMFKSDTGCPKGVSQAPIVIQAQDFGQVVLQGDVNLKLCGEYIVLRGLTFSDITASKAIDVGAEFNSTFYSCDYCALRQTTFDGSGVSSNYKKTKWIEVGSWNEKVHGVKGFEVSDSNFLNKANEGVFISLSGSVFGGFNRIYRNVFMRPNPSGESLNNREIIRVGDSHSSHLSGLAIIENNLFYDASGESEIVSIKTNDNAFRYNTVIDSNGAISVRIGKRNIIEGNYIVGVEANKTGGIRVSDDYNLILGNHLESLKAGGSSFYPAINLLSADDQVCYSKTYCPTDNAYVVGNYLFANDTGITLSGAKSSTRHVAPKHYRISRNFVEASSTRYGAFYSYSDLSEGVITYNSYFGWLGWPLASWQFSEANSLSESTQLENLQRSQLTNQNNLSYQWSKPSSSLINFLQVSNSRLAELGLPDYLRQRVSLEYSSVYERSGPLNFDQVGIVDSNYNY